MTHEVPTSQTSSEPTEASRGRVGWLVFLGFAVLIAAYVGFRLPSLYTMTLYNIGFADGAWRRGVFATALSPLWEVTGHRYGVMALVALGILSLILGATFVSLWLAQWNAQRLLLVAWFISPVGAYLFHEVGYLDQFIYVLFFLAAVMVTRLPFIGVVLVMAFSVLVHEITLVTTLPLILLLALFRGIEIRQIALLSIPVIVGVLLYFAPSMTEDQVGATGSRLQEILPFEIRWDAVALFGRSLSETWAMEFYSPWRGFATVLPLLLVSTISMALVVMWLTRQWEMRVVGPRLRWAQVLAVGAVAAPYFLVFLGWDFYRWAFLGLVNFVIVAYVWLSGSRSQPTLATVGVLLLPLAILFHTPLEYFDGYTPRPFTPEMIERITYSPHTEFLGFPNDRL